MQGNNAEEHIFFSLQNFTISNEYLLKYYKSAKRSSNNCNLFMYQLSSVKVIKISKGKPLKIFQPKDTDFKSAIPSAEHYKKEQGEEKCTSGGDGEFDQYRCVQPPPRPGAAEAAREGPWRPWRRPLKATFILQCGTHHTPSPGRPLQ